MKKLVFISSMATPYMVKLCYELQDYFDTEFWFYEHIKKNRFSWRAPSLGKNVKYWDWGE